jgi:hypothetical protein
MSGTLRLARAELERLADATGTPLPWPRHATSSTRARVPRLLGDALATFGAPEVVVDVDVVVRGGGQLRSWQRLRDGRVTAIAAAGPETLELAWFEAERWDEQLARAATVDPPSQDPSPPRRVDVPFEDLVTGRAGSRLGRSAGRLPATVAGPRGVGWSSWLLFADGWRELTPYALRGVPMVCVRAVAPRDLGSRVRRLAAEARS